MLLKCLPEHDDEGVCAGEGEEDERQDGGRAAVEDGGADGDEGGGGAVAAALSCSKNGTVKVGYCDSFVDPEALQIVRILGQIAYCDTFAIAQQCHNI